MDKASRFHFDSETDPIARRETRHFEVLAERTLARGAENSSRRFPALSERILVPLDGSAFAEHALPAALAIARRSGATIQLALVHSPFSSGQDPWSVDYVDYLHGLNRERVRQKRQYLDSVIRRIGRRDTVEILPGLFESEQPGEELAAAARLADMVVMATRARGQPARLLFGSMADSLLRQVRCPMLLVRGHSSPVDLTGDPIPANILVPLDGTESAECILPFVVDLAHLSGCDVTLLHVTRIDAGGTASPTPDALDSLEGASRFVGGISPNVSIRTLQTDDSPATAILSWANRHDVDMIAVSTTSRSRLSRLLRRSVADAAIHKAGVPVLIMRRSDQFGTRGRILANRHHPAVRAGESSPLARSAEKTFMRSAECTESERCSIG